MDAQRVTLVTLAVGDLAVSRAFYERLGWVEAMGGNDDIAFYKLRGLFMSLYCRDKLTEDIGLPVTKRATGAITLATNYASRDEVDAAYKSALDAGAVAIVKPEEMFWGGYSGNYADPDGHLWEVALNPFWSFDDDGYLSGDA